MERSAILTTMGELKLYGMKAAFDEIITTAVKRQHEPQRIVGDLLTAEIARSRRARSSTRSPSPLAAPPPSCGCNPIDAQQTPFRPTANPRIVQ